MPVDLSLEFGLIVVTEGHIGLHTLCFSLLGGEVESEHVSFQKLLVDHLIENWGDSFLGKSWISHTDNSFEIASSEDGLLLLYVTEFLVLNMDLTR